MNNIGENIVFSLPVSACDRLKNKLEELLAKMRVGIIPEEYEIDELKWCFQEYIDEVRKVKGQITRLKRETDEKSRLLAEKRKRVMFSDILPEETDDAFDTESFRMIENIRVVQRLALRKLLPEMDDGHEQFVGYLMKNGYITVASIEVMGKIQKYHMLTTKGWHMLRQKNSLKAAMATAPSFGIPEKLQIEPANWETEVFLRAAVLGKYYERVGVSEYMIFTDDSDDRMLFGCEIRDSYSVCYSFAACFANEREESEASILYEIAKSDKVDCLTIILLEKEEEKQLELRYGLDTRTLKKLRYYVLPEEEPNEDNE